GGARGGAVPADGASDVMSYVLDLDRGIPDGNGEADATHDGHVGEIVAEKGDFGFADAGLAQHIFIRSDLLRLLLVDQINTEFLAATAKRSALAPGDHSGAQAGGASQRKPLAVVGVERLDFQSRAVRLR